jgi:TolB-like protein/Tfp pilus assembly protein PilF
MFTDIVGYTAIMGRDEDKALKILRKNREIHRPIIKKYRGEWLKEMGDGNLASFRTASDAVRCAGEIQQVARKEGISLRIGIHEGEVVFKGNDILGDGVNVASRLEELAEEGHIYISGAVYKDVKNKGDISTEFIVEKELKNVDEPIKIYRVNCEINEVENNISEKEGHKKFKRLHLLLIIIGIVFLFLILLYVQKTQPSNKTGVLEKSIAVRPFWNESTNKENEYFVNGMTEDIRNNLAKVAGISVRSRGSVEKYRDTKFTTQDIAKDLKVTYVLEGTAQRLGTEVKIHVQLILAENDDHIWETTYREDINDVKQVFDIQSQIAQSIGDELEVIITPYEKQRIETIPTGNTEAYDLFLKGKEYYYRGGEANVNTAIHFYQHAIELDPQFAQAYIWLGFAYHQQTYWSDYFKENLGDTLIYFSDKALTINPDLADGYWLRGLYYTENGDYINSVIQLEKAIDLNPNFGDAYALLGWTNLGMVNYIDAIINFEKARKLKIGDPDYADLLLKAGHAYHCICDYEKTEALRKELINYNPLLGYNFLSWLAETKGELDKIELYGAKICAIDSGASCYNTLSRVYYYRGDHQKWLENYEIFEEMARKQGDLYNVIRSQHRYADALEHLGRKKEALELYNKQIEYCNESIRLQRIYAADGGAFYDLAGTYALLGNKEMAYHVLHIFERERLHGLYVWYMQVDPIFKNFWEDDEFKAIIQRQEKKYAEIRTQVDSLRQHGVF